MRAYRTIFARGTREPAVRRRFVKHLASTLCQRPPDGRQKTRRREVIERAEGGGIEVIRIVRRQRGPGHVERLEAGDVIDPRRRPDTPDAKTGGFFIHP